MCTRDVVRVGANDYKDETGFVNGWEYEWVDWRSELPKLSVSKGRVPCTGPGPFFKWVRNGDIIQKMGDVTHFMEGYFYVGCRFIGISYFLTKFGEW